MMNAQAHHRVEAQPGLPLCQHLWHARDVPDIPEAARYLTRPVFWSPEIRTAAKRPRPRLRRAGQWLTGSAIAATVRIFAIMSFIQFSSVMALDLRAKSKGIVES